MPGPRVSILINNFNYARFLRASIDSALAQTWPDTEVIVVDDCSTDGSQDLIRTYDRVTPILRAENGGQAAAMNQGFAASRGEIVIFLDADDYLIPDAVEQVVAAWRPGAAKVHYRLALVDALDRPLGLLPAARIGLDQGDVIPLLLRQGRYQTTVTSGNAFSRRALERMLPIPEREFRISADGYLVTLAPLYGPVIAIDRALGAYRLHGDNAWATRDGGVDAAKFRRALGHDRDRYRVLTDRASALGHSVHADPGLNDWEHLERRLCSLALDPGAHPVAGDRRPALGLRAARLSAGDQRLPAHQRALLAAWFASVGLLPGPLAKTAIAWRLAPGRRPALLRAAARLVRSKAEST